MKVQVHIAGSEELQGVAEFYDETEYSGGILPSDRIVVALSDGRLVGAYRLVREHDLLVLRGMRVRASLRRQGIGVRLLHALTDFGESCYCVPHACLEGFYGHVGFALLANTETPGFLLARAAQSRGQGLDVIVMRREPATPDRTT